MTNYRAGFQGQYIAAVDFGVTMPAEPTLTIRSVPLEKVEQLKADDGDSGAAKMRDRWIVYCEESHRGWVMNRTNAICLAAMFGDDVEGWVGHKVTLHAVSVQVGPKKDLGIRIKGSPELTVPKQVQIKLPRKKAQTMVMQPTGKAEARTGDPGPRTDRPAQPITRDALVKRLTELGWLKDAEAHMQAAPASWSDADTATVAAWAVKRKTNEAAAAGAL